MGLHFALVAVVAACSFLGWWQLTRAISGNTLSWVYTFEWPFFAVYGFYMWWRLIHEPESERERRASFAAESSSPAGPEAVPLPGFDPFDESDPELAAYNRYLASLHSGAASTGRRRPALSESAPRSSETGGRPAGPAEQAGPP